MYTLKNRWLKEQFQSRTKEQGARNASKESEQSEYQYFKTHVRPSTNIKIKQLIPKIRDRSHLHRIHKALMQNKQPERHSGMQCNIDHEDVESLASPGSKAMSLSTPFLRNFKLNEDVPDEYE